MGEKAFGGNILKYIRNTFFIILILCISASSAFARRSTDPMTTITSVRAIGMGRAGLATLGGSNALFTNPAGLTKIKAAEASIFSTKLMDEFNYFGVNGAMNTEWGWFGLGYGSMSIDGIPETFRYEQGDGIRTYKLSEYGAGNNQLSFGYASKFEFLQDLSVGFTLKQATEYIEAGDESTFDSSSESSFGVDAGLLYPFELFDQKYEAGLAMQNLMAPTFTEEGEEDSMYAVNMRLGISTMVQLWEQNFLVAADTDVLGIHLGTEWQGPGGLALRAGFDADNIAVGLGLKIFSVTGFDNKPHTIAIDYAYRMYEGALANTSFLGFSYLGVSQTEKPAILNPISGKKATVPTMTIEGTAGKGDEVTVYINDIPRKIVRADEDSGIWSASNVFLNEGKNEVRVQAEKLDFAASEFSDPIIIEADLTPAELTTVIEKEGNEITVKARVSKKMSKVATRLPNNQTLALVYDPESKIWVGKWVVPLKFMDKKLTLQTRGVDESGKKTDIATNRVSTKIVKYPLDRTITTEETLSVRGTVPVDVQSIIVGDQVITPEEDGTFETTVALPEIGKQLVEVQVVDAKGATVESKIRVLRKATAADISQDSFAYSVINDLLTIGALSTDEQNNLQPQEPITRGELAALIARVKGLPLSETGSFPDIPANSPYLTAITAVTKAGLMNTFADGQFRPDDTISRADAVGILVRVNEVPLPEGTPEEIFNDVPLSNPAADVIAAAANVGLISMENDDFYPNEPLDRETAAMWFSKTTEFRQEIQELSDWRRGFGLPSEVQEEVSWESQLIVDFADVQWTAQEEAKGLKVIQPADQSTVYEEYAIVKGMAKEVGSVTINGQKTKVDKSGAFVAAIPLDPGPNVIIVEAPKEKKIIRIYRETNFEDIPRGEAGKNLRVAGTLGFFETDDSFYPENVVTREELAIILVRLKRAKPAESNTKISDLAEDNPSLPWVQNAVDLGYFKLGANNTFNPEGMVTRGEAMQILNKFQGTNVPGGDLSRKPFADVAVDSTYAKDIGAALQAGLIPQTENFYPDNPLTRQELVDILMNTKLMQDRIKEQMDWETFDQNKLRKPLKPKKQKKSSRVIGTPSYARTARGTSSGGEEDSELLRFAPPMERQLKKGTIYPRTASAIGESAKDLSVISPRDLLVTTKTDITVAGVVKKNATVLVNGSSVPVNPKGAFQKKIGLKPGKNIVDIESGTNTEKRRVLRLITYGDILRSPQKKVIEYLATLGYFAAGGNFQPSKTVAKDELVTLAVKVEGDPYSSST